MDARFNKDDSKVTIRGPKWSTKFVMVDREEEVISSDDANSSGSQSSENCSSGTKSEYMPVHTQDLEEVTTSIEKKDASKDSDINSLDEMEKPYHVCCNVTVSFIVTSVLVMCMYLLYLRSVSKF